MSHPKHETFCVNIPINDPEAMDKFQEVMNSWQDEMVKYENSLAKELGISTMTASAIVYLRGRSRWTQEKEDHLIQLDKAGTPMDIGLVLSGEF